MGTPKYQEIVDRYPADFGTMKGEALNVVKGYDKLRRPDMNTITDEELERVCARKRRIDELSEISNKLANAVNGESAKLVAEALYLGLCNQHRTLQAKAINTILELLKLYKDTDYDLRNHAAVVAAAAISEFVEQESLYIPVI